MEEGLQVVVLLNRMDEIPESIHTIFLIDETGLVDEMEKGDELERFFKMYAFPDACRSPRNRIV